MGTTIVPKNVQREHKRSGWLNYEKKPSPFFDERPNGEIPNVVVIHYISLPAGSFLNRNVENLFLGNLLNTDAPELVEVRGLRVSSHFFINRLGCVTQFVDIYQRAWHAGLSNFKGRNAVNDFSIGIELEGTGEEEFTNKQYEALDSLLETINKLAPIGYITGHSTIAPGRKADPGPMFDWERLSKIKPKQAQIAINKEDCSEWMIEMRKKELKEKV